MATLKLEGSGPSAAVPNSPASLRLRSNTEKQMMSIWRIVFTFRNYVDYEYPVKFGLSGTPLNETLIALHQIIPQFKKENKIQKVHYKVCIQNKEDRWYMYHETVTFKLKTNDTVEFFSSIWSF